MAQRDCPLCGEPLEESPAIHDVAKCENTELLKGRKKIKELTASLHEWKYGTGGWFELREIIGFLWWHHPAIDSDEKRAYYQNNLKALRELTSGNKTTNPGSPVSTGHQVGNTQGNDGNDSPGRSGQGESGTSQAPAGV